MPIKEATIYFSQLSKIITIIFTTGFIRYDLSMLYFVIPAAIIGGLVGCKVSPNKVTLVFQGVIILVLFINLYNGWQIIYYKKIL
jgi:uncharacterized membrane protein YfcA